MWTSHGGGMMECGRGQYLYDEVGAQYLDCVNSTAQVGHCDGGVLAATCHQLGQLVPDGGLQGRDSEFERLLSSTLPPHLDTFFHCDSGTQAVDLAVRLSRLWCGKKISSAGAVAAAEKTSGSFATEKTGENLKSKAKPRSDPGTSGDVGELSKSRADPPSCSPEGEIERSQLSSCSAASAASSVRATDPIGEKFAPSSSSSENPSTNEGNKSFSSSSSSRSCIPEGQQQSSSHHHVPASAVQSCLPKSKKKKKFQYSSHESGGHRLAYGDVVVVEGSFHGCTDSVVKLSSRMPSRSHRQPSGNTYAVHVVPLLEHHRSPSAAALQRPQDAAEASLRRQLAECRTVLQRAVGSGRQLACLLVEPHLTIQGGQHPPPAWLQGLYSLVREHGGLCISDEVQSGLGRLGDTVWGFQSQGVTPDIIVIAKGIGNGLPMAVTVTTAEIGATLGPLRSAYQCSALQDAVGAAVLHSLHEGRLMHSAATTGRYLRMLLLKLQEKHPYVGDVRGRGLLQVLDIVWTREQRVPSVQIADFLVHKLRRVGVVIAREGPHKNVLVVMPPMTFDMLDAASLATKIDEVLCIVPHTFGLDQPGHFRNSRPMQTSQKDPLLFLDVTRPRMLGATYADVAFESHYPRDSVEPSLSDAISHPDTQGYPEDRLHCSLRRSERHPRTYGDTLSRSATSSAASSDNLEDSISSRGCKGMDSISVSNMAPTSAASRRSTSRAMKRPLEDITAAAHRSAQVIHTFDIDNTLPPCSPSRSATEVRLAGGDASCNVHSRPDLRSDTMVHSSGSVSLPEPTTTTSVESTAVADSSSTSHAASKMSDIFSNIILVERDVTPDYSRISSPSGTFVGRSSQRLLSSRHGLQGQAEGSEASAKADKKDLHPNELPRTCDPLGSGLGMVQPVPARPPAPTSPRFVYQDVD